MGMESILRSFLILMVLHTASWSLVTATHYNVTIETADLPGAGTADDVDIQFYGSSQRSNFLNLGSGFNRNSVVSREVTTPVDIKKLVRIKLRIATDVWIIRKVTVHNIDQSITDVFTQCEASGCQLDNPNAILSLSVPPKVDGQWTDWSPWACQCPSGNLYRTRTCTNPPPNSQGEHCIGNATETNASVCVSSCSTTTVFSSSSTKTTSSANGASTPVAYASTTYVATTTSRFEQSTRIDSPIPTFVTSSSGAITTGPSIYTSTTQYAATATSRYEQSTRIDSSLSTFVTTLISTLTTDSVGGASTPATYISTVQYSALTTSRYEQLTQIDSTTPTSVTSSRGAITTWSGSIVRTDSSAEALTPATYISTYQYSLTTTSRYEQLTRIDSSAPTFATFLSSAITTDSESVSRAPTPATDTDTYPTTPIVATTTVTHEQLVRIGIPILITLLILAIIATVVVCTYVCLYGKKSRLKEYSNKVGHYDGPPSEGERSQSPKRPFIELPKHQKDKATLGKYNVTIFGPDAGKDALFGQDDNIGSQGSLLSKSEEGSCIRVSLPSIQGVEENLHTEVAAPNDVAGAPSGTPAIVSHTKWSSLRTAQTADNSLHVHEVEIPFTISMPGNNIVRQGSVVQSLDIVDESAV